MLTPDAWLSVHSLDERVTGPEVAAHAFGPFVTLDELRRFEDDRGDSCYVTIMPLFMPSPLELLALNSVGPTT